MSGENVSTSDHSAPGRSSANAPDVLRPPTSISSLALPAGVFSQDVRKGGGERVMACFAPRRAGALTRSRPARSPSRRKLSAGAIASARPTSVPGTFAKVIPPRGRKGGAESYARRCRGLGRSSPPSERRKASSAATRGSCTRSTGTMALTHKSGTGNSGRSWTTAFDSMS